MEKCIGILQIVMSSLDGSFQSELQYVLDTIRSGQIMEPNTAIVAMQEKVDAQTAAWMVSEMAIAQPNNNMSVEYADGEEEEVFQVLSRSEFSIAVPGISTTTSGMSAVSTRGKKMQNLTRLKSLRIEARQKGQTFRDQMRLLDFMSHANVDGAIDGNLTPVHVAVTKAKMNSVSQLRHGVALGRLWDLALRNVRMRRLLSNVHTWCSNVFHASELTFGHPLYLLTYNLLHVHGVVEQLRLDDSKLQQLLVRLEIGYPANPYHNSMHAADVVQTVNYFISQPLLLPAVQPLDILATFMSAAAHDYAHPGVNNAFEIATRSTLALRYNDISVLENMHVSSLFQLLTEPELNILASFSVDEYKRFRQLACMQILGTDMAKHFDDLGKLKTRLSTIQSPDDPAVANLITTVADTAFYLQTCVHTADVSNPAKPLCLYRRWVDAVVVEFYEQGDKERDKGLTISPFFDRHQPNVPKLQMSFIDFIVAPLFAEWAKVCPDVRNTVQPLLQMNRKYWERKASAATTAAIVILPAVSSTASSPVHVVGTPASLLATQSPANTVTRS